MAKYCPQCGNHLLPREIENEKRVRPACTGDGCGFIQYDNARPCVGAILYRDDGRILLIKRKCEPCAGEWDLPGGYVDGGEHPEVAVVREVQEETTLRSQVDSLVGIWMQEKATPDSQPVLNLVYAVRFEAGQPQPKDDVQDAKWVSPAELPAHLAFEHTYEAVKQWLATHATSL